MQRKTHPFGTQTGQEPPSRDTYRVLSGMPQSKENALELQSMAATGKVLFLGILCQKEGKCRGGKEAEDKSRFAQGDGDENPGCRFQEEGQTGLPGGMPKAAPREAGGTKENNYL
ncbi:uncharacterized protein LOC131186255 isoform X3 [Ahaetulla prasina]|uniref:uncharacterized protein LOC131186255 isoform X3 n=1 Tax=Ahaetulla prasina TaxID=499056 RepID=UPI0026486566|nr:uncharacterized protein LOC131186255 isoform X3 [Ahaetulla prasina]